MLKTVDELKADVKLFTEACSRLNVPCIGLCVFKDEKVLFASAPKEKLYELNADLVDTLIEYFTKHTES